MRTKRKLSAWSSWSARSSPRWVSRIPTGNDGGPAGALPSARSPSALDSHDAPLPPGRLIIAMSEDDSSSFHSPELQEKRADRRGHDKPRSWLERISSALSGEPTTREDLVELL